MRPCPAIQRDSQNNSTPLEIGAHLPTLHSKLQPRNHPGNFRQNIIQPAQTT